jgi:HEPN domain-containing protein
MIDIQKQIDYWRNGALEDWEVANELVGLGRIRHGLFFAHLALEKMLKAHVCQATGDLAPKIHNLVRLAELAGLSLSKEQEDFLAQFDMHQLEGRYPDKSPEPLKGSLAKKELEAAEEVIRWLSKQF